MDTVTWPELPLHAVVVKYRSADPRAKRLVSAILDGMPFVASAVDPSRATDTMIPGLVGIVEDSGDAQECLAHLLSSVAEDMPPGFLEDLLVGWLKFMGSDVAARVRAAVNRA